jgi:hypothetical protein
MMEMRLLWMYDANMSRPQKGPTKKSKLVIEIEEREGGTINRNKVLSEISP